MKTTVMAVSTLIFVYWCQSFCFADPAIQLHKGPNTLAVSIVNGWNSDLMGVSAYVEADELPSWLCNRGRDRAWHMCGGVKR